MPTTLEDLPPEMLQHVTSFLENRDMRSLMAVSRTLRYPAEKECYKELDLTRSPADTLILDDIQKLICSIEEHPRLARYVQSLHIPHFEMSDFSSTPDVRQRLLQASSKLATVLPARVYEHLMLYLQEDNYRETDLAILLCKLPALKSLTLGSKFLIEDKTGETCDVRCRTEYDRNELAPEDIRSVVDPDFPDVVYKKCNHTPGSMFMLDYSGAVLDNVLKVIPSISLSNDHQILQNLTTVTLGIEEPGDTPPLWEISLASHFMRLPSVKSLDLQHAYSWQDAEHWICGEGESNVTKILITQSALNTPTITKLIKSCKRLESVEIRQGPSLIEEANLGDEDGIAQGIDWPVIVSALEPHAESLRDICLQTGFAADTDWEPGLGPNDTPIKSLRNFKALKEVFVDETIIFGRTDGDLDTSTRDYANFSMLDFIPDKLDVFSFIAKVPEVDKMRMFRQVASLIESGKVLRRAAVLNFGASLIGTELKELRRTFRKVRFQLDELEDVEETFVSMYPRD